MITEDICCNCRYFKGAKGVRGCAPCKMNGKIMMWDDSCKKIWLIPKRLTIIKPTEKDSYIDYANFLPNDSYHDCESIEKTKPITNADRIRNMSDEELAKILHNAGGNLYWSSEEFWLYWLKQEMEEDK